MTILARQRHRHAAPAAALRGSPEGLANSSGLVGKRLMMHPFGTVVGVFDEDFRAWQGPWGQFIHSLEFYETDASRGFVRGAKWGLQPTGGPFSMTSAYPWGAENEIWGPGFQDAVRGRLGHSTMWGIIAEDLPEESNRVVLDPEVKDAYGIAGAKIEYKLSENSRRLVEFHQARATRVAARRGRARRGRRAVHPGHRLAPARHDRDGRRPGDVGGRRLGAAPTTSRTCTSSTAACGRRRRA